MNDFETAKQHFLGGLQLLEKNDVRGAESEFTRSLELLPDRVSTLNNLSTVKLKQQQFQEAEKFARRAIALENTSTEAWANLALALTEIGNLNEALQACDHALSHDSFYARAWLIKAGVLLKLQQYDKALAACEHVLKLQPGTYELLYVKSQALKKLGRREEAIDNYMQALEARAAVSPVVVAERRTTQKTDVLIIAPQPYFDDEMLPFEKLLVQCPNYPGQLGIHIGDDIHFTYVFVNDAARESAQPQLPKPDLLINDCANGQLIITEDNTEAMTRLMESFNVPIINHPQKVVAYGRDSQAKLLEDIPGLLVPKTLRLTRAGKSHEEIVKEIEDQFTYPFITRSLTRQRGKGMNLATSREKLIDILNIEGRNGIEENFFVTQFYDSRTTTQYYRKMRAAVVNKEIIIVRVDFSPNWCVHGRKFEKNAQIYVANPFMKEEEDRICENPEAGLGKPVMDALRTIVDRVPLEIFGIDFNVHTDGRVIFYEANATMNLFSTAHHTAPNPKVAEDRLKAAFVRYFTSVAGKN